MNYRKLYVLLLLILPFFSGCNDDEKEKISCRILSVKKGDEVEEYIYNNENKVQTVLRTYLHGLKMTGTLAYNDKGQLTKYTCTHNDNDFPYPAVTELIYDGKEKPQKMYFWSVWEDSSLPSTGTYYFHYDEKGRLIIVDGVSALGTSGRRFEYDKNDNVIKVFLIHFDRTEELLTEFLTFDSKPNLYEQVPELKMINIYSEFNIPNKNNVLTAKVFRDPKDPLLVTFEPTYDGRGLIIGNRQLNDGITGLAEFSEVTRDCQ